MAIDVHTDTNNNVVVNVQAQSVQSDIDVVPSTSTQNDVETHPLYGPKGEPGRGIESIDKTATVENVDTYTITYTDGDTSTFDVTNGITPTTYVHTQAVASDTWEIIHNLGKRPSYEVVDSAYSVQIPNEVIYNSDNQITMKFLSSFSGYAYLN